MCSIERRHSNICNHTCEYTKECRRKRYSNRRWAHILSECKIEISENRYHEICHTCRRFFEARGITQVDALHQYKNYRQERSFYGPLSPHVYKSDKTPVLMPDGELEMSGRDVRHSSYSEKRTIKRCDCFLCLNQNQPDVAKICEKSRNSSSKANTDTVWLSRVSTTPVKDLEFFS